MRLGIWGSRGRPAFVVLFAFDPLLRGVGVSDPGAAHCRDVRRR